MMLMRACHYHHHGDSDWDWGAYLVDLNWVHVVDLSIGRVCWYSWY